MLPPDWNPDNIKHWQTRSALAYAYLWSASGILVCAFAVWMQWSVWVVYMPKLGFLFSLEQRFSLLAIAGLSGALFRIPATFLSFSNQHRSHHIVIVGVLLLPIMGTSLALQNPASTLLTFQALALFSGFGAAVFSISITNVSALFPQRQQALALGLHAGLGNLGLVLVQVVVPVVMSLQLLHFNWLIVSVVVVAIVVLFMHLFRIRSSAHEHSIRRSFPALCALFLGLGTTAFISLIALYLILPKGASGAGLQLTKEWVLVAALFTALWFIKHNVRQAPEIEMQFRIFNNKHTWLMSVLYVMSFGTFIGFASVFPLLSHYVFGFSHNTAGINTFSQVNPHEPSMMMYCWFGPLLAIVSRPLGGWLGDRYGGSKVTFWCAALMGAASIWMGYSIDAALQDASPERYFVSFILSCMVLFIGCGFANGSLYRTLTTLFPKSHRYAVIGWVSSIGACGAFYVPLVLGENLQNGTMFSAFVGFSIFYFSCMALARFFYLDKNAEHFNP